MVALSRVCAAPGGAQGGRVAGWQWWPAPDPVRSRETVMLAILALACLATARARAVGSGKDGLQVEVTREEDCKVTQQAEKGDKVTVHYGGFLQDGESNLLNLKDLSPLFPIRLN